MPPDDVMPDAPTPDEPLDAVLDAAEELFSLDAARAEAWVSGLLAEWPDHEQLLDALAASSRPEAAAIAAALGPILPEALAVTENHRTRGIELPPFAAVVGTARAIGAWSIVDPFGGRSIVVEYEHADGVRHDVLAELDGALAIDLLVAPEGVVQAAEDDAGRDLQVRVLDVEDAHTIVRDALLATAQAADHLPLTDAYFLNHAVVAARVGAPIVAPDPGGGVARAPREADPEGDALALATLRAALGPVPAQPLAPQVAQSLAGAFRAAADHGETDAHALVAELGWDDPSTLDDTTLLLRVAAAYIAPGPRAMLSPAAADAIDGLEAVDWLGAVLPLVRAGAGASADPEQLVRNINRCPEVTTSIPKRDIPNVASAFGAALPAWRACGAIDAHDRLTDAGVVLLPWSLAVAWGQPLD